MDATELGRWTRFAAKGGIGKCTALQDCVAEESEDLMFMKDDEITVLMRLPEKDDLYLGYCEGVVGRFSGSVVQFHSRLKKPVMAKRSSSLASTRSRRSSSQSATALSARDTASPALAAQLTHSYSMSTVSSSGSPRAPRFPRSASASASPSPHASPLRVQSALQDEDRARSASHSSISTALESAPISPADFPRDEVRVASAASSHHPGSPAIRAPALSPLALPEEPSAKRSPLTPDTSTDTNTREATEEPSENVSLRLHDESYSVYDETDASARISVALSDGELGIGLSLLQDFMGGHDGSGSGSGDDASFASSSRQSGTETPPVEERTPSPSTSPNTSAGSPPDAPAPRTDVDPPARALSQYSASALPPSPSRASLRPSLHDSEAGGSEWEGASDIYDNYRYSRFSVASRASRMSKGSLLSLASGPAVPPVPPDLHGPVRELDARPSVEFGERTGLASGTRPSVESFRERTRSDSGQPPVDPVVDHPAPSNVAPLHVVSASERVARAKPSPLSLVSEPSPFPLLHAAFGSPAQSPTPGSSESFAASTFPSAIYPAGAGGAASAARQRLELERGPRAMNPVVRERDEEAVRADDRKAFGRNIVAEDDNSVEPSSAPPPPYTPLSPHPPSPQRLTPSPLSPSFPHQPPQNSQSNANNTPPASRPPNSPSPQPLAPSPLSPSFPRQTSQSSQNNQNNAPSAPRLLNSPSPQSLASSPLSPSFPHQPPQSSQSTRNNASPAPRPLNLNRPPPSPNARTSLFLPHPHAPKPTHSPTGPLYGRQPVPGPSHFSPHVGPPPGSVVHALQLALSTGRPRQTTIYGLFEHDLASAVGPVPISFGLEPQMNVPAHRPGVSRSLRGSPVSSPPLPAEAMESERAMPQTAEAGAESEGPAKAIPRANFFPQVSTVRPRSRSFSGFDTPFEPGSLPNERSQEEGGLRASSPSMPMLTKRSKSALAAVPMAPVSLPAPQRATVSHSATVVRAVHAPSPLSLSQNNVVAAYPHAPSPQPSPNPSPNPSTRSAVTSPVALSPPGTPVAATLQQGGPGGPPAKSAAAAAAEPVMPPHSKIGTILEDERAARSSLTPKFPPIKANSVPVIRHSKSFVTSSPGKTTTAAELPPRSMSSQGRRSGEDAKRVDDMVSIMSSLASGPSRPTQGLSRISTSTSALRVQLLQHEERSPSSSVRSFERDQKTVQVQDMDFEMVRPGIPQSPLAENSADSLPLPSLLQERANSTSGELPAPPPPSPHAVVRTSYVDQAPPESRPHKVMDAADIEAHRQRELRWISTMSSVSPSQARKSKKVRKMVLEGVPASVRYLVWAHLTDSKAKRMEGLYTRLLQREKVAASADIERDVRQLSVHLPVMHDDSLMNVLQAYLSMVPDIQYSRGLCSIASQLLLLSPEEDAFWTFISLMDTHLRPYFSSNAIQLDVDAALFGKAVEANDSALAKKIFLDMAVSPISVCRPWFTSLFVGALSPEYFHRVWDVFLFEGVPFLFRIGIALLTCCRQLLLKCAGHDPLFAILSHPPANYLPRTPDALIDLALSVKLKDEDIRKQRSKLEAQVKRQTQSRVLSSALPAGISVPAISLPRS